MAVKSSENVTVHLLDGKGTIALAKLNEDGIKASSSASDCGRGTV